MTDALTNYLQQTGQTIAMCIVIAVAGTLVAMLIALWRNLK